MNRSKALAASRQFWWVNQGRAYKPQRDGGYIWAPQRGRGGTTFAHHRNVGLVSRGDVILHYAKGAIRAVGLAIEDGQEEDRPEGLPGDSWKKEGYLARIRYWELDVPIQLDHIPAEWRIGEKGGPFNKKQRVNQGYLFPLGDDLADRIRRQFSERWPGKSPWGGVVAAPELDLHQLELLGAEFLARTPGFEVLDLPRFHGRFVLGVDGV